MPLWMFVITTLGPFLQGSDIFVNLALANEQGSAIVTWVKDNQWLYLAGVILSQVRQGCQVNNEYVHPGKGKVMQLV